MSKKIINYSDLYIGMMVADDEGNIGVVKNHKDIHNIVVEYNNGGSGLHCLVKDCCDTKTINGEKIEIPLYDPLYYYE